MAQCSYCETASQSGATFCPQCGTALTRTPPPEAQAMQEQAATAARETWVRIQAAGPSRVGLGLMALSIVFAIFPSQRGIWGTNLFGLLFMVGVAGYVGTREFLGKDLLPKVWWAPLAAVSYLALKGLSGVGLRLGSLVFLAGALLLAWSYLWPLRDWARSSGWDWRYGLHGFRRPVALGAVIALASLLFTWLPSWSTGGYWSGGYSYRYNSYSQQNEYQYDMFKNFNVGISSPSVKGLAVDGSVLLMALILGAFAFATLAPRFPVPRWYRFLPFMAPAWGLLIMLLFKQVYWGSGLFLAGAGLMAWGGYHLSIKGEAEGKGDLRELPLERWLARWL